MFCPGKESFDAVNFEHYWAKTEKTKAKACKRVFSVDTGVKLVPIFGN